VKPTTLPIKMMNAAPAMRRFTVVPVCPFMPTAF
jgi:hypothetical protein